MCFQTRAEALGLTFERDLQDDYGDNRIGRRVAANPTTAAPRVLAIGHYDTVFPSTVDSKLEVPHRRHPSVRRRRPGH